MGLGIGRKMSLKGHPVRARLRILRQQPGDGRIASVRRDQEPGLDGFVTGGDFPTCTVLNPEHRIPEFDLGSRRNGMFYQGIDQNLFSEFRALPWFRLEAQIESSALPNRGTRPIAIWQRANVQ